MALFILFPEEGKEPVCIWPLRVRLGKSVGDLYIVRIRVALILKEIVNLIQVLELIEGIGPMTSAGDGLLLHNGTSSLTTLSDIDQSTTLGIFRANLSPVIRDQLPVQLSIEDASEDWKLESLKEAQVLFKIALQRVSQLLAGV